MYNSLVWGKMPLSGCSSEVKFLVDRSKVETSRFHSVEFMNALPSLLTKHTAPLSSDVRMKAKMLALSSVGNRSSDTTLEGAAISVSPSRWGGDVGRLEVRDEQFRINWLCCAQVRCYG